MSTELKTGNTYRAATGHVRESSSGEIEVVISTDDLDRHGTVLDPAGVQLADYERNPVVLFGHDLRKVVGTSTVRREGRQIVATMKRWAESAADVRRKIENRILRAASVGFRIDSKRRETAPDGSTYTRITKWTLVEWSWVSVPSNPHAVARSLEPLELRGDPDRFTPPKGAPIAFTDEQLERLLTGGQKSTAPKLGGTVRANLSPGTGETEANEHPGGREGIVRGAHAVFGPGPLRGPRVAGALANPPRKAAPAEEDAGATVRGMW